MLQGNFRHRTMFLNGIQPQTFLQRQFVATLQQCRITLVNHFTIDGDTHCLFFLIDIIVRHREESFSLQRENFFDTTSHGIYHIEMNHSLAKTFIAEMPLWAFMIKSLLNSSRNEVPTIAIIQFARTLHKHYALLHRIVLMSYGIMQGLADGIFVILLHGVWEQRPTWQLPHGHITNLCQYLIHS